MSQNTQPNELGQTRRSKRSYYLTLAGVGIIIVVIVGLAYAGNSVSPLSTHVMTVTQQQFMTNTQDIYSTQTEVVTNIQTLVERSVATVTSGLPAGYYQYCNYYNCNPYPAPPGYYKLGCYSTGAMNTIQCYGYMYEDSNGCVDLLVPVDNGYTNQIQQYYNLQNLPSSYPSLGSSVTVTGQLFHGHNAGPNGGACPDSYIDVTSIS